MATITTIRSENQNFIIVTGLSGSGMSSATNAFEDLGYFCVDNLPITMVSTFARLLIPNEEEVVAIEKAALVINIRERHFLHDFSSEIKKLEKKKIVPFVLFFEAKDSVLQRRFSETRRPHPADKGKGLLAAIQAERDAMSEVRKSADLIIDTSDHTVHTLRRMLVKRFGATKDGVPLQIQLISFGHKHGVPRDVDLLFDVRHLPNPYFEKKLRNLPGTNPKVVGFLEDQEEVLETIRRFTELLIYLLPLYKREGKSYLTIGIGCTGGRHRSVMTAETIARNLGEEGFEVSVVHRDIQK
ncbi:MAG: RNase adapter RapZ [Pyrinomonadaceae bacterium]